MNEEERRAYYAYPTLADFEGISNIVTNADFRLGWRMARATNEMLGIDTLRKAEKTGEAKEE